MKFLWPITFEYLKLERPSSVLSLTFWLDQLALQTTTAYFCNAITIYLMRDYQFLGNYYEKIQHYQKYVSASECRDMVHSHIAQLASKSSNYFQLSGPPT